MATVDEILASHDLRGADADHLHRLIADWQLLADLSFADLLLVVPQRKGRSFVVVAQMRPTTAPTAHQDDLVGVRLSSQQRPQLETAWRDSRIVREGEPVWVAGVPVREEALPVIRDGRALAVVARDTNLAAARTPSRLELAYLASADDLAQMLCDGTWPGDGGALDPLDAAGPRVGDGLIRLDAEGNVTFVSPNALSAYRRLGHPGDLIGRSLVEVTRGLARVSDQPIELPAATVAAGRLRASADVESNDALLGRARSVVQLRAIPLVIGSEHVGALILVRDVTELRRRERMLLSKDATIREIHHRVKNNLQTVAALLRLQARRVSAPEAREALDESVRRVTSIAVVHETLSGSIDEDLNFDEVADRVLAMITEVAAAGRVRLKREGSFGILPAEIATPLALIVTELVQNSVEHAYPDPQTGTVTVTARWVERGSGLTVVIADQGPGFPEGFDPSGSDRLGLQIVRTLIETELGGDLTLDNARAGGAEAVLRLPHLTRP